MGSIEQLVKKTLGQYYLEKLLGVGGMGAVYQSTDERLQRKVAVKVLIPSLVLGSLPSGASFRDRFLDEARVAAKLEHPNILHIYYLGVQDDIAYLVMQYAPDGTLKDRLDKNGPLSLEETANYLAQASRAMDYAHANGVVHRDVKPANFLLAGHTLLLSDFGIARLSIPDPEFDVTTGSAWTLTAEGFHQGTPAYMAPEQVQGGTVDYRADIYSLGIMLYQMLCGEVPFKGWDVTYKQVHDQPPSLKKRLARYTQRMGEVAIDDIDYVVMKALAKNPADRYESAGRLAADFLKCFGPYCPKCHRLNRPLAKFCQDDGEKLPSITKNISRICINCGAWNRRAARFCYKCATPLNQKAARLIASAPRGRQAP